MMDWPWYRRLWIVLKKELTDHLRDRRSIFLAMIYPLLGPMLLGGGVYFAGQNLQYRKEKIHEVPAIGAEHAPELVAFLEDNNVTLIDAPENPRAAVRDGTAPLVVIFPPEARDSTKFTVTMLVDLARVTNVSSTSKVKWLINAYNARIAKKTARAAGLPEDYGETITLKQEDVKRERNLAIFFYNLMPPLFIFMIFLGAVYLSIDTTAGERERGSLEPLLIAPVERWVLLLAKSTAAFGFTAVTVAINLATFMFLLGWAAGTSPHMTPPPGIEVFATVFLIALPLMAVAVTLQMTIAMITRSMKEAQIYLGLLPLVPALPGMVMVLSPLKPETWNAAIPVLGQMVMFTRLVAEESVEPGHMALASLTTTLLAVLIFWKAARLFRREKMFFLG